MVGRAGVRSAVSIHATQAYRQEFDPFEFAAQGMDPDASDELLCTAPRLDGRTTVLGCRR